MTDYGITSAGFVEKTLENILDEIEQAERASFGPAINTQADSALGIINGIFADKLSELWEVALAVYRARQPDSANDEALDNVAAITGASRLAAQPSEVNAVLNLDATTTVPAGSVARIGSTGARWVTKAEVQNTASYPVFIDAEFESESSGEIVGNAFAIDTIAVPVAGWLAKAAKQSNQSEPYALEDEQTLTVQVDEGAIQTVTFITGDFVDISAATADEVVDAINADITGATAEETNGSFRITSDTDGTGSVLKVTGGTAFEALGISAIKNQGFNPDTSAILSSTENDPLNLGVGGDLYISVDEGSSQLVEFTDDYFDVNASGTITVVDASLLVVGADTDTFVLDDGVNPAVTFIYDDDSSVVVTVTNRAINHTGLQTQEQIKLLTIQAINNAPLLEITATSGGTGIVDLVNNDGGVIGNVAITETVADAGFIVTGMSGGAASTLPTASIIQVAKAINAQISNAKAYKANNVLKIESLTTGANSHLKITGGDTNILTGIGLLEDQEVAGVNGDATLGRDIESDADFRVRREELIRLAGAGTIESIRANVRAVNNVEQAFVYENITLVTDAFGRPGKSIEVLVSGGADQDIAQAIFDKKPGGIETYKVPGPNGITVAITDSQGEDHDINFSRADTINYYIDVEITVDQDIFGGGNLSTGEQQVKDNMKALGDTLTIGEDIFILQFACAALNTAGVLDVTSTKIEDITPPTNTSNISIDARDLAVFATSRMTVTTSYGTP